LKRNRTILTVIVIILVTNLVTYSLATGAIPWIGYYWGVGLAGTGELSRLTNQYRLILTKYIDEVDPAALVEGALAGMADALGDPYTYYMDPREYEDFDISLTGEYVGVGMVVEKIGDYVCVVSPMRGSPAERAGLRARDRIVGVDGRNVVGLSSDIVAGLIRGKEGTPVTLTIARGTPGETEETFDVTLVRERIIITSAFGDMLYPAEGLGYIQITEFSAKTPEQFGAALADLKSKGLRALVLDLRNNGGGLLQECITIARLFVAEGTIVQRVGRGGRVAVVSGTGSAAVDVPLVVLINEGTASAAEILAGAIKDNGVGILVGVTTFGKGSIQTPYELGGGSVLRLTTEKWLTPEGEHISGQGIEPHVRLALPEVDGEGRPIDWDGFTWSDPEDPRDTQLRYAVDILRQALEQENGG
jgi:carboxyl-terminal processing protease